MRVEKGMRLCQFCRSFRMEEDVKFVDGLWICRDFETCDNQKIAKDIKADLRRMR